MIAEKAPEPAAKQPNSASPRRTRQGGKKQYCGACPACQALQSTYFSSPSKAAEALKSKSPQVLFRGECITGFLQEHYGNAFTQAVLANLPRPEMAPERRRPPDQKIARAHAGLALPGDRSQREFQIPGPGSALDFRTRSFMEARLGHSFGDVRTHTGSRAARAAKALNAHAFTVGTDIYFGAGKYRPESLEGKSLLAHELTHVVQNKNAPKESSPRPFSAPMVSSPADATERQADGVSQAVVRGDRIPQGPIPARSNLRTIYRKTGEEEEKSGWLTEKLAEYASQVPGFTLITFILGKNPITGRAVERNAKTFLQAIFGLVPGGEIFFKKLDEAGVIDQAFDWIGQQIKALNLTWELIKGLIGQAWEIVKEWSLPGTKIKKIIDLFAPVYQRIKTFCLNLGKKIMNFVFETVLKSLGIDVGKIMGVLNKVGDAFSLIASDPVKFLKNLLAALGKGFRQFSDNIWEHLKAGLMGWIFGALEGAGLEIPKSFDLKSIFGLVMQVLGLTKAFLRKKIARVIGEKNLELIEKAWGFISTLISSGISGLWEMVKEYLGNLKDLVLGMIQEWVVAQIVKSAITKLIAMFNPVGAIITAVQTIYNTVMFFVERMKQIMELVNAIVESILPIAQGVIDKAANWVETAMARTLPVIISFLARFAGLGGISEQIKRIIKRLQDRVENAVDKVIDAVVKRVGGLLAKGTSLLERGRAAVAGGVDKVKAWFIGKKETEVPVRGKRESHTLWFEIEGEHASLLIATKRQNLVEFLGHLEERIASDKNINEATKKKTITRIRGLKSKASTGEREAQGVGRILSKVSTKEGVSAIQNNTDKLKKGELDIAKELILLLDEQVVKGVYPKFAIVKKEIRQSHGFAVGGKRVKAENISLPGVRGRGSQPSTTSKLLESIMQTRGGKMAPYVRGHLLNHHLGGPGDQEFNLTPITGETNSRMSREIEEDAKKMVLSEDKVIDYTVNVEYGGHPTAIKDKAYLEPLLCTKILVQVDEVTLDPAPQEGAERPRKGAKKVFTRAVDHKLPAPPKLFEGTK